MRWLRACPVLLSLVEHACVLSTISLAQRRECRRQLTPRPRELTPLALCFNENGHLFIHSSRPRSQRQILRFLLVVHCRQQLNLMGLVNIARPPGRAQHGED